MDVRKLTDDFAVSPQIAPEDIPTLAQQGFRAILCNRPDDEDPGQCCYDDIAAAAQAEGIEIRWIPIQSGMVTPDALTAFQTALDEMPKPLLAYCRSGTRCTMLWTIIQAPVMAADDLLTRTAQAGYDMSGLLRQLAARQQ